MKKYGIILLILIAAGMLSAYVVFSEKTVEIAAEQSSNIDTYKEKRNMLVAGIVATVAAELQPTDVAIVRDQLLLEIVDSSAKNEHVTTILLLTALENALLENDLVAADAAIVDLRKRTGA